MKKKIVVLFAIVLLTLTGCTKYLSDDNNKRVVNEKTGQNLTANILCLPEDNKLLEEYKKYEKNLPIKIEELPKCTEMKIYEKKSYNGLWVGLFVRPLAWCIIKLGKVFGNYGLSVMIIGLIIRIIMLPISAKTAKQQENMKKIQPEMSRIEKKYENKTDQESMMKKSQETLALYQKYNINPMSSCLVSFIQLPLFFAFLEAINRVPAIFENYFWKFQLGTTPLIGIKDGNYYYVILIILILVFTALSFKQSMASMSSSSEQVKQTKYMLIFMTVFIGIASFQLPSAIALYWVVTNAFNVIQMNLMKKRG
ncbi:MAG: YidC/Oxa1 family membrane protein insertase [Bacilli bacterium]|jgi:YidC/Oxa1 family membrane protein insertase|nr:YidC/Oxa1 family membrane protein insertase [Bacilli bacterium]